jgi:hypothetical protein
MKKTATSTFLFLIILGLFSSCLSRLAPVEAKYENVYIGMPLHEFRENHSLSINEYMDNFTTCYSIKYYKDKNGRAFVDNPDVLFYKKFYYFENKQLIKVDKGERAIDYKIKIVNEQTSTR